MTSGDIEQHRNVLVVDAVVDDPSLLAGLDRPSIAELPELVTYGRFARFYHRGQVTYAELSSFEECVHQAQSARVREKLESGGDCDRIATAQHPSTSCLDTLRMDRARLAGFIEGQVRRGDGHLGSLAL